MHAWRIFIGLINLFLVCKNKVIYQSLIQFRSPKLTPLHYFIHIFLSTNNFNLIKIAVESRLLELSNDISYDLIRLRYQQIWPNPFSEVVQDLPGRHQATKPPLNFNAGQRFYFIRKGFRVLFMAINSHLFHPIFINFTISNTKSQREKIQENFFRALVVLKLPGV